MEFSFSEMILFFVIAFLVLGPKELVIRSRQVGQWLAKIKTEFQNFKIMAEEQLLSRDDLMATKITETPAVEPAVPSLEVLQQTAEPALSSAAEPKPGDVSGQPTSADRTS